MDADAPKPDDLNELERRLVAWRPAGDGLDADALLFAAGRASAARARILWPALAACLALVALALGAWVASERTERLALAQQLRNSKAAPALTPGLEQLTPVVEPPPNSLLAEHRRLQKDFDGWLANAAPLPEPSPGPTLPVRPVPRVGRPDDLFEP